LGGIPKQQRIRNFFRKRAQRGALVERAAMLAAMQELKEQEQG
jgi:hypothetical protein